MTDSIDTGTGEAVEPSMSAIKAILNGERRAKGLPDPLPLPPMRASIYVHPQLGELWDRLSVQLYAMGYADDSMRAAIATQQAGQGEALKQAAYEIEQQAARLGSSKFDRTLIADQLRLLAYELRAAITTPPAPQQPEALAQQERDREDVLRWCWYHDGDERVPVNYRLDEAGQLHAVQEGEKA